MHISNSLTLLHLLSLYINFLKGEVGGLFFLWLGARHNKRGDRELGGKIVLKRETTTTKGLLAIYLSQQQELQDGCLPYVNWV